MIFSAPPILRRPDGIGVKALTAAARSSFARALTPTPNSAHPNTSGEDRKGATASLTLTTATDKQGSRLVRWAAVEAVQCTRAGTPMRARYEQVVTRRGTTAKHVAKVAAARELLDCVFYALRDGRVRPDFRRSRHMSA